MRNPGIKTPEKNEGLISLFSKMEPIQEEEQDNRSQEDDKVEEGKDSIDLRMNEQL